MAIKLRSLLLLVGFTSLLANCARPGYLDLLRRAPTVLSAACQEFFVDGPKRERDQECYRQAEVKRYRVMRLQSR